MRILIATTQVPFVRGGAEIHAEGLRNALCQAGHIAEIVAIPFKWYPPERIPEHILACRLLDLSESCGVRVDRVIGLRFPAYCIPHPNKVLWILHQYRAAYDLWDTPLGDLIHFPDGRQIRDVIHQADRRYIAEAQAIYANSGNVSKRLKNYCDIDSTPLYHPPQDAERFYSGEACDSLFFPSRINRTKRQDLVIEALAHTQEAVQIQFAGMADDASYQRELRETAQRLGVGARIEWLGEISEEEKRDRYAHALGVLYPPLDEDYGYVTLEAMLSARPVITCADSGGPLEFIRDGENGRVTAPTPQALAQAMDELWQDRARARRWGEAGREDYAERRISWQTVISTLTQ
ncbi:MAG TPA: glycosyltransferase family 4 protein [Candidatus Contendobacter sp.]|nr:glycosyltransferase family 4 protein [Candidatus Contendobacter sp.]HRD49602.1 glycosyltransferase family 4 protein [Candidatus Contendobacter sp.]